MAEQPDEDDEAMTQLLEASYDDLSEEDLELLAIMLAGGGRGA